MGLSRGVFAACLLSSAALAQDAAQNAPLSINELVEREQQGRARPFNGWTRLVELKAEYERLIARVVEDPDFALIDFDALWRDDINIDAEDLAETRAVFEAMEESGLFERFHAITATDYAVAPQGFEDFEEQIENLTWVGRVAEATRTRFALRARLGDWDGAIESLGASLACASFIERQCTMFHGMFARAHREFAMEIAAGLVASMPDGPAHAARLADSFERWGPPADRSCEMRGEVRFWMRHVAAFYPSTDDDAVIDLVRFHEDEQESRPYVRWTRGALGLGHLPGLPVRSALDSLQVSSLMRAFATHASPRGETMRSLGAVEDRLAEFASRPSWERQGGCLGIAAALEGVPERDYVTRVTVSSTLPVACVRLNESDLELSRHRAGLLWLRVLAWQSEFDRWPESAEVLRRGDKGETVDPMTGVSLRFRAIAPGESLGPEFGVVVYSVGPDRTDDGGGWVVDESQPGGFWSLPAGRDRVLFPPDSARSIR